MADNPKLTIELVEKGGAASQANPGVAAGTSSGSSYDSISSFHERVTSSGIQAPASPIPESRMNPVTEAQQNIPQQQSIYSNPPGFVVNPGKDNAIESAVNALLQATPTITPQDVSAVLGIKAEYATQLIDRARANTQSFSGREIDPVTGLDIPSSTSPTPVSPIQYPTQSQMPTSTGYEMPRPSSYIPLWPAPGSNVLNIDPVTGLPEPTGPSIPSSGYEGIPSEVQRIPQTQSGGGRQPPRGPNVDPVTGLPEEQPDVPEPAPSGREVGFALNTILNSTRLNNPIISQAASVLPALGELGGIGSAIVAAAPPIAAVGGAIAATYGLAFNEANRAVAVSREFSPDVALADAFSELRQLRADLKSAQTLGPAAADYIDATSRISTASQGIRDTLGKPVVESLTTQLEGLATILERINARLEGSATGNLLGEGAAKAVDYGIGLSASAALGPWGFLVPSMLKYFASKETKDEQFDLQQWFNDAIPMMPLPVPFNAMDVAREQPAGVQFEAIPGLNLN